MQSLLNKVLGTLLVTKYRWKKAEKPFLNKNQQLRIKISILIQQFTIILVFNY